MKNKLEKIHLNIGNKTKCYVSYDDYKKMEQSYKDKLKKKSIKTYKKYDEMLNGEYFVLDVRDKEIDICRKNVLSREEVLKYFTDKWYQDSSDYCVRYNSDIRNNKFEDSYIYKILNGSFKEDRLKDLNIVGDVRLLTKEETENLDDEHKNIGEYYWTMTPYNDMNKLEYGQNAGVFFVYSSGCLNYIGVDDALGVRPVFTLKIEKLEANND